MFFPVFGQRYLITTQNNLKNSKNRTVNALKPVSKLANGQFNPYLSNGTSDRLIITSKVLKIKQRITQNRFKSRVMNVFARILVTVPPIDS